MDLGFKFEIGSVVRMVLSANQKNSRTWGDPTHKEQRGLVIERRLQECPGGIQRHYLIRWVDASGDIHLGDPLHNEIELVQSEPFPANEKGPMTTAMEKLDAAIERGTKS